jgi:hypothetical protein
MTLLDDMPVKDEETPIFWGAVDFSLSQLSLEFSKPTDAFKSEKKPKTVPKIPKMMIHNPIPVVETSKRGRTSQPNAKTGVNHLNLIQIKGAVAHKFQPRLVQEGRGGRSVVVDPLKEDPLASIELNRILLQTATK